MSTATGYVEPRPVADAADRAVSRSLTLRYILASTAIFLVSGLLGAVMRQSQADIYRLDGNAFKVSYGGTGSWQNPPSHLKLPPRTGVDMLFGDFDGDGFKDVFATVK